jgi:hypothetical protein
VNITEIAKNFGCDAEPVLLTGGHGTTYRCGDIILKPVTDNTEANEIADIVANSTPTDKIRIPRPLKSKSGEWISDNFVAWEYLIGEDMEGEYETKIAICDWFSNTVNSSVKPKFLDSADHAWAMADKVSWGEIKKEYNSDFESLMSPIYSKLEKVTLSPCLIHGDLNGNIIFDKSLPPAVIDMTLYWRPKDFAKAIMIIDGIVCDDAPLDIYKLVEHLPEMRQLMLRAGLRRILEQAEHAERGVKSHGVAFEYSQKFVTALNNLNLL